MARDERVISLSGTHHGFTACRQRSDEQNDRESTFPLVRIIP
jgi:hypothetical protein